MVENSLLLLLLLLILAADKRFFKFLTGEMGEKAVVAARYEVVVRSLANFIIVVCVVYLL